MKRPIQRASSVARRQPRQARSRELVRAIVDAAKRILSDEHAEPGFSTNRVEKIAGVSIGSLYQYFPGKSSIVAAVAHARLRDTYEPLLAGLEPREGRSLESAVSDLVDGFVAMKVQSERV